MIFRRKNSDRQTARPTQIRSKLDFSIDSLETRTMLTATLFVDFGDGLPGAGINLTTTQLRDIIDAQANTGPSFIGEPDPTGKVSSNVAATSSQMQFNGPNTLSATDDFYNGRLLRFESGNAFGEEMLITDYIGATRTFVFGAAFNGMIGFGDQIGIFNGTLSGVDVLNIQSAAPLVSGSFATFQTDVINALDRMFEPFDVDVQLRSSAATDAATFIADLNAAVGADSATGDSDAYVLAANFSHDGLSLGDAAFIRGKASSLDLSSNGVVGGLNPNDEVAMLAMENFGPLDADEVAEVIAHEAGHTLGLIHRNPGVGLGAFNANQSLLARSEVMTPGVIGNNIFMRFPLIRGDGNMNVGDTAIMHDLLANNVVNVGLRANAPAYITGTGAHDEITITETVAGFDVAVQPYSDSFRTTLIGGAYMYSITNAQAANGLLVEAGQGNDLIMLSGSSTTPIEVRGGTNIDEFQIIDSAGNDFELSVTSFGEGSIQVMGGAAMTFSELNVLDLDGIGDLDVIGTGNDENFLLDALGGIDFQVGVDTFLFEAEGMAFEFRGNGGSDKLSIDNSGNIVDRFVDFHGGLGFDTLEIEGNPGVAVTRETYIVGATQDAGTWILDPNDSAGVGATGLLDGDELVVNFTGLDPVDTSTPAVDFDIFLTAGADDVRFEAGGFLAGVQSVRVVDVAGTFETFRYANKQNVTLDGLGDDDTISSTTTAEANGEVSRMLVGNAGNDTFLLGGSDTTSAGGQGNDTYQIVNDADSATLIIEELLGEGSDTVDFSALATPAMATDQSGTSLATAGAATVNVAAAGQQKNIEFGINAAPFVAYTMAPAIGVPFMTMNYEVEYADVGTMSSHTANFDWGDGNSDPGVVMGALGMGTATGSHQFDTVDVFNVIATITDDEALSTSDVTMTMIQQFALLPDQKNPALTALYVGGTVGIDVIKFKSLNTGDIRAILNGDVLGEFSFDGSIFAYGGSGNDLITPIGKITKTLCFEGGGDVDVLRGSDGDDFLMGQGGKDTIVGRGGNDTIEGGTERDYLFGKDGDDTILAGVGNDVVRAGNGSDYVDGGSGNDVIFGEAGDDVLLGRGNDDRLVGGAGDDVIGGGSGTDTLLGGGGNDLLLGEASTHDSDPVAWLAIRDEWVFSAAAIPMRITNIMVGGGLNGANILSSGVTVFDDGQTDRLVSGGGLDWYLVFPIDNAQGVSGNDTVTTL